MGDQVVIALTPAVGLRLADLPKSAHLWIARAPETERLADGLRRSRGPSVEEAQGSVTLFNSTGDAEADLAWLLDEVELHHGLASNRESPVTVLRIIGAGLTPAVRATLASHNFSDVVHDEEDLVAHWVAPR